MRSPGAGPRWVGDCSNFVNRESVNTLPMPSQRNRPPSPLPAIKRAIGGKLRFARVAGRACGFLLPLLIFATTDVQACTIFVLTDAHRALFCNNEDWLNPQTRIWFVPAGAGYQGCGYLGFDDGWAQGGLNTQGLAFDWVAGFMERWERDPAMKGVRGNPSQRMLETCTTVEEATAFYRTHWEPGFSRARILVADRTGASVIIGAKDGRLQVEKDRQSLGFGYGRRTLDEMLAKSSAPTVANGVAILRACLQAGKYATKYSNVFDLNSGDIFLFMSPDQDAGVKLNLAVELAKGAHYYDLPQVRRQLAQPLLPLVNNLKRFLLDDFRPVPDREPQITEHIRATLQDALGGTMRPNDYTPELWKDLSPAQKDLQTDLNRLGELISLTLVESTDEDDRRSYRYLAEFGKARALQHFVLDAHHKVALIQSEGSENKSDVTGGGK
jgi:hypothetical protein